MLVEQVRGEDTLVQYVLVMQIQLHLLTIHLINMQSYDQMVIIIHLS